MMAANNLVARDSFLRDLSCLPYCGFVFTTGCLVGVPAKIDMLPTCTLMARQVKRSYSVQITGKKCSKLTPIGFQNGCQYHYFLVMIDSWYLTDNCI